ncbi:MAG: M48 family metallopeptidase [Candidatus Liptonbacteria bacterium]
MDKVSLYTHRGSNIAKTWLLMSVFLVVVIGLGWLLSQYYGDPSILYGAAMVSILMSVTSFWYSDKIVLSATRAAPVTMQNNPELFRVVENLAITAGLPMPRVYTVPELQPNAFATGRSPKHAVVAVTDGLIQRLDRSELEGVLAHELSHIGNRDMLLGTVAVVLVGFVSMLSDFFGRSMFWGGGRNRDNDRGSGNNIFAILAIVAVILAPIAATLLQLAISRKREFLADASGALLTRYPEGLASALRKISADPTPMRAAGHATAHLWLSDPFRGKAQMSGFSKLFLTHPPMQDRISALMGMKV